MIFIGKVLAKAKFLFPDTVFNIRCRITDSIISKHSFGIKEQGMVIRKANMFLSTMSPGERAEVMASIGVKQAPSWNENRSFHMGD